ncbi:hypothetical protein HOF40_00860 [Candidatus Parcubacteria bacterium]|jgi:hypothetical protein|nr:hypothetical protein [Candidatus Parcubacteria bacterium]MBT3948621.1 hypothetical protein [Candidatus Parcubacteria bacterium]
MFYQGKNLGHEMEYVKQDALLNNESRIKLMDKLVEIGLTPDEASEYINLDSTADMAELSDSERERLDTLNRKIIELKKSSK